MSLEVKPGQQIKASQYNALAASVSQSIGATDTPFRSTGQGMIVNGGNAPYVSKAQSQNDKFLESRVGRGTYPMKFEKAGQEFYGTFVNVSGFLNMSVFAANRGASGRTGKSVQLCEVLYVKDPSSSTTKFVGFDIATSQHTPSEIGFDDASNIWCPVSELTWDSQAGKFVGGDANILVLQIISYNSRLNNGEIVLVLSDSKWQNPADAEDEIKNAILNATGYNDVHSIDKIRVLLQYALSTPQTFITPTSKPLANPVTFFDGTMTVGNDPDSDVDNLTYSRSIETTELEQLGLSGALGKSRGTHSYSLYHFGRISSDINSKIPWKSPYLSSFDVLLRYKKPHPKEYEDRAYAELMYASLSSFAPDDIEVDSNLPPVMLSSIQTKEDDDGVKYHQMFAFEQPGVSYSDLSSDLSGVEIVLRESVTLPNGSRVNYMPIQQLSSVLSGGGSGAYWNSGGDSSTCFGSEIKIGNVLIYEVTV